MAIGATCRLSSGPLSILPLPPPQRALTRRSPGGAAAHREAARRQVRSQRLSEHQLRHGRHRYNPRRSLACRWARNQDAGRTRSRTRWSRTHNARAERKPIGRFGGILGACMRSRSVRNVAGGRPLRSRSLPSLPAEAVKAARARRRAATTTAPFIRTEPHGGVATAVIRARATMARSAARSSVAGLPVPKAAWRMTQELRVRQAARLAVRG
jgi:hypothetical protein